MHIHTVKLRHFTLCIKCLKLFKTLKKMFINTSKCLKVVKLCNFTVQNILNNAICLYSKLFIVTINKNVNLFNFFYNFYDFEFDFIFV